MGSKNFYLLSDSSLICSYLSSMWIEAFSSAVEFQGILLKEEPPSIRVLEARKEFHANYTAQKPSGDEFYQKLATAYKPPTQTECAMIEAYGIPKHSTTGYHKTIFLGNNLNGDHAKKWLLEVSKKCTPSIFVCTSQILKPWWIEITQSQIFNCHSAVLPYARGMYSIENMAIRGDITEFRQAAGTTVHYLDQGVDTGPIIASRRILDPFKFDSIWALKAYSCMLGFELYTKVANDILTNDQTVPVGIVPNPELKGPNFRTKEFTLEKQKQAEEAYLWMKSSVEYLT